MKDKEISEFDYSLGNIILSNHTEVGVRVKMVREVISGHGYRKLPDKESIRVKLIQLIYGDITTDDFVEWIYEEVSDNIC